MRIKRKHRKKERKKDGRKEEVDTMIRPKPMTDSSAGGVATSCITSYPDCKPLSDFMLFVNIRCERHSSLFSRSLMLEMKYSVCFCHEKHSFGRSPGNANWHSTTSSGNEIIYRLLQSSALYFLECSRRGLELHPGLNFRALFEYSRKKNQNYYYRPRYKIGKSQNWNQEDRPFESIIIGSNSSL